MKNYLKLPAILLACSMTVFFTSHSQETENPFLKYVEGKQYVFMAQTYTSSSIPARQIIEGYFVKLSNDSLISSLPYYGQHYSATQTAGSIDLKSIKFDHTAVKKKKETIQVTIRPNDTREVQQLFFTIFPNGSAQLQVLSTNREPMSFTGYITAVPK